MIYILIHFFLFFSYDLLLYHLLPYQYHNKLNEEDEDGSDVESEDNVVEDESDVQSEGNDGDQKPKAKTMVLDTSTCNSEASQPGPSSDEYTNDETTAVIIHEKNTLVDTTAEIIHEKTEKVIKYVSYYCSCVI